MTAENATVSASPDPWALTPEIRAEAERISLQIREIDKKQELMTPVCPVHPDKVGKFVERRGAYTRVKLAFRCPKGHDFLV